jgi:hypothetical protein
MKVEIAVTFNLFDEFNYKVFMYQYCPSVRVSN